MHRPEDRPAHPTIEQIREVCQPPEIRGRKNSEHWTGDVFTRSLSPYLTRAFVRAGLSANAVTVGMILCGWAAAAALLIPGWWGPLLAAVLAMGQMLLDASDGEVARWTRKMGPRGIFLDRIAHTTTESLVPMAAGFRIALEADPIDWRWAFAGTLLGMLVLWNKSLNDGSRLARVQGGMPLAKEDTGIKVPTVGWVARARRAANLVPIHRAYHSVEQTLVMLALATVGLVAGFNGVAVAVVILLVAAPFVIAGHTLAILTSSQLKVPATPES
ncbi:CDP-alcohol phosphatidyltransferase family protein [Demequina litorisediminis]|uniref:Transferase n=1 Tax=Demequina litorisediminis TaxID=1849022 RepID=A0ABQ6II48_9MICO|nr:CDP-alcohol phosphatidyltransferase family protein [Demequina litorisediminis]GMA36393.1 transferase [Demequina litorisediminis]